MTGVLIQEQHNRQITILLAQGHEKGLELDTTLSLTHEQEPLTRFEVHRAPDHPAGVRAAQDDNRLLTRRRPSRPQGWE